ncbi:flagellar hook-length control protein FliK [Epibacterium ulvae]|uniref:flagellar hook-length control protein FliK n=1 Tax=Epibacterium ulvae TaxID=1156985 RepID=UPI001BFC6BF5|nr:flagellar hook-length control protein FliK [Epibacterium ulvae]MBT8155773.1 flagellar hook-length control protein FliK [Epibacterium ulvae]
MNPVNIGQSADVSQNSFGQKSVESKKGTSQSDSFSVVFAETGAEEESLTEVSETLGDELAEGLDSSEAEEPTSGVVSEDADALEDVDFSSLEDEIAETEAAELSKADALPEDELPVSPNAFGASAGGGADTSETDAGAAKAAELASEIQSETDASGSGRNQVGSVTGGIAVGSVGADSQASEKGVVSVLSTGRDDVLTKAEVLRTGSLGEPLEGKFGAPNLGEKTSRVTLIGAASVDELPYAYRVRLGIVPVDTEKKTGSGQALALDSEQKMRSGEVASQMNAPPKTVYTGSVSHALQTMSPFEMTLQSGLAKPTSRSNSEKETKVEAPALSVKSKPVFGDVAPQAASAEVAKMEAKTNLLSGAFSENTEKAFSSNEKNAGARGADSLGLLTPTQVSQTALLTPIGLPHQSDAATPRLDVEMRWGPEAVGISQALTEATFKPLSVPGNEVVQRIAAQLSEAFASKGERKVDVMLNPKELGKVKMQLATSDGGVRVMIHVERAETGDLMRRHIGELEKEFREMGFENISFSFTSDGSPGQSDGSGGYQPQGSGTSAETNEVDAHDVQTKQTLSLGGSGLDMRV